MQLPQVTRTALAVLFAPIAAIPAMLVLFWLFTIGTEGDGQVVSVFSWSSGVIGALIAYPVTLVVGLPAHVLLYRHRLDSYPACVFVGAFFGLIVGLIINADEILSTVIGCSVALAFRAIAGSQVDSPTASPDKAV